MPSTRNTARALPPDLPLDEAILIEPFAVGVHAARRGQVEGKKVLVVGAGTIGNFVAQAAQLLGAEKVAVCDLSEEKVEMARKAGIALPIVSAGKTLREVAAEAFGPEPADVIIDCVGATTVKTSSSTSRRFSAMS